MKGTHHSICEASNDNREPVQHSLYNNLPRLFEGPARHACQVVIVITEARGDGDVDGIQGV